MRSTKAHLNKVTFVVEFWISNFKVQRTHTVSQFHICKWSVSEVPYWNANVRLLARTKVWCSNFWTKLFLPISKRRCQCTVANALDVYIAASNFENWESPPRNRKRIWKWQSPNDCYSLVIDKFTTRYSGCTFWRSRMASGVDKFANRNWRHWTHLMALIRQHLWHIELRIGAQRCLPNWFKQHRNLLDWIHTDTPQNQLKNTSETQFCKRKWCSLLPSDAAQR